MSELKEIRDIAMIGIRDIAKGNKDKINEAYKLVMRLCHVSYLDGLPSLEYEVGFIPKDIPLCKEICTMVQFVADGMEPEFLAELMTLNFMSEDYHGVEALLYFLYARGVLLIQAGEKSRFIEAVFSAVIPSDILNFDLQYNICQDEKKQKVENIKKLFSDKEKSSLHNIVRHMSELTEAEWNELVMARKFCDFDRIVPYLDEKRKMLVREHVNESRYHTMIQFPYILKEDEICQIEAEFEAMLLDIRSKSETKGKVSGIIQCSAEEMNVLIKELDNSTIALALKGESKNVKEAFLKNVTPRLKYEIQEEMEYMGPVRECDVEDAQRRIRKTAKEKLGWQLEKE